MTAHRKDSAPKPQWVVRSGGGSPPPVGPAAPEKQAHAPAPATPEKDSIKRWMPRATPTPQQQAQQAEAKLPVAPGLVQSKTAAAAQPAPSAADAKAAPLSGARGAEGKDGADAKAVPEAADMAAGPARTPPSFKLSASAPCWVDRSAAALAAAHEQQLGAQLHDLDGIYCQDPVAKHDMYLSYQMLNPQEAYVGGHSRDDLAWLVDSSHSGSFDDGRLTPYTCSSEPVRIETTLTDDVAWASRPVAAPPQLVGISSAKAWSRFGTAETMTLGFEQARKPASESPKAAQLERELDELKKRLREEQERSARQEEEITRLRGALREVAPFVHIEPERLRDTVRHVLDKGWDNITWRRDYNALHLAGEVGCMEVVKLLMALGADPAAKDFKGRTAADIAASKGHPECAEVLANLQQGGVGLLAL